MVKAETDLPKKDAKSYLKLPYARILIPAEEGGFSAEILEFPGCYADGETPNEAFENLESVAESWIEATFEQGQEIPPPSASEAYSGRFALRLPRDLHKQAARKANRDGISLNQCFVTAIAAWIGADNLFERVARKVMMNFVQTNFCKVTIFGGTSFHDPFLGNQSGAEVPGVLLVSNLGACGTYTSFSGGDFTISGTIGGGTSFQHPYLGYGLGIAGSGVVLVPSRGAGSTNVSFSGGAFTVSETVGGTMMGGSTPVQEDRPQGKTESLWQK